MEAPKTDNKKNNGVRTLTFFPPFILLAAFVVLSIISKEAFLGVINTINNWIINNLGWAASLLALFIVIITAIWYFYFIEYLFHKPDDIP